MQTLRESTGNVQLNLFIYKLKKLIIPILPMPFQLEIETLVKSAHANLERSKKLYAEAEDILLAELGLKTPPNPLKEGELLPLCKGGWWDLELGEQKQYLEENSIKTDNLIFSPYHLPYNPKLKQFSRDLRNDSELAEVLLWNQLKGGKTGYTFNRQKPILNYIADFYCKPLNLVIEIDGQSHFSDEAYKKDQERDRQMQVLGLRILRILDSDVRKNMNNVLRVIEAYLTLKNANATPPNPEMQNFTPPNPLKEGELSELPLCKGGWGDSKNSRSGWGDSKTISIKSLKDSFLKSSRLDAEYYQPKYDEIEAKIKSYKGGWDCVNNLFELEDKNYNPKSDKEYKYIELSNIGSTGDITDCSLEIGENLPSRARRKVTEGNIIISSIEGSLQSCAMITKDYEKALCSTGFYVLSPKNINSETAILLFKSAPLQNLMKKACSGTILTAMNKNEFLNIIIPKLPLSLQSTIATKIQQSFALKAESKALLEQAKEMVEMEIEKNKYQFKKM